MPVQDKADLPVQIRSLGLLLLDGFALMSYASVIEAFRAANTLADRTLYRWDHISVDGDPIRASNGATIIADRAVGEPLDCDMLFVFAGGDPRRFKDGRTFAWIRRMAARGTPIAGISAGPYILARAGILDGYQATIHWEHRPAFLEEFPASNLQSGLYVIDRRRVTCAGGLAGMDLAIELIERDQGHVLAARVSDWFIRGEVRAADRPQRLSLRERYGVADDTVLRVLALMEMHVEEPMDRDALGQAAGVSVRQLDRLFQQYLHMTVNDSYIQIRLQKAEQLLRTTTLPVTEIAFACGFRSASHFSRRFLRAFGMPPSRIARQTYKERGSAALAELQEAME